MITTIGAIKLSKKDWKTVTNILFVFPITIILFLIKGAISVVGWLVKIIANASNATQKQTEQKNVSISKNKIKFDTGSLFKDEKNVLIYVLIFVIIIAIIISAAATNNSDKQSGTSNKIESSDEDRYRQFGFDEVDGGYQMRESYKFMNPNYKGELVIPETYNDKPIVEIRGLDSAFGRGITKIVGSKNLVTIKHATFASRDQYAMPNLTEVIFPIDGSLKTIESHAFYWQNSLKTVILPSSIEFIGAGAFDKCYNLQNLVIYNHTPPTIERNIFVYIESSNDSVNTHPHPNFTVFVPEEAVEVYEQSEWGKYNIKAISEADFIEHDNWTPPPCLTYNYQYEDKKEKVYIKENDFITLPTPSRLGYTFGGWYDNNTFSGNPITELSNIKDNLELFAKWTGNNVYIIYDGNGNTSGTMNNQLFIVGEKQPLYANEFVRDGYTFIGWTLDPLSNDLIDNQSDFSMIPTSYEAIKLYAKWAKEIKTVDDFNTINEYNTGYYILSNDIDFSDQHVTTIDEFYGIFDGNGHTLSNSSKSLFISNAGVISNLIINNSEFAYEDKYIGGFVSSNSGTIQNCGVIGEYVNKNYIKVFGGFCAINVGKITNSYAKINGTISGWSAYIGGFIGTTDFSDIKSCYISNCYVEGNITIQPSYRSCIGGFVGCIKGGAIKNSFSNLSIQGDSTIGGFVGCEEYEGEISNCFAMGKITTSSTNVGGFASGHIVKCVMNNVFRSNVNLFTNGYVNLVGNMVENPVFTTKEFYITNSLLQFYVNDFCLQENENAVWIIIDGELPKLYWETIFP